MRFVAAIAFLAILLVAGFLASGSDVLRTATVPSHPMMSPTVPAIIRRTATVTSTVPPSTTPQESVAFQINPAHTGATVSATLAPPLTQAWAIDLKGIVSYPLVADNRVYVVVAGNPTAASRRLTSQLVALDVASGRIAWGPIPLGVPPPGYPETPAYGWGLAFDNGAVFVVDRDSRLRAFDARSGTLRWATTLADCPATMVLVPPIAAHGMIYVDSESARCLGQGSTLYKVDEPTGTIRWSAPEPRAPDGPPVLAPDGVFVATSSCPDVYRFSYLDGALQWRYEPNCVSSGGVPAVYDHGRLYIPTDSRTLREDVLDATRGSVVGHFTGSNMPAIAGTRGFVIAGFWLQSFDVTTGAVNWKFSGDRTLTAIPIVVNHVVYTASALGHLYALDARSGHVVWQTEIGPIVPGFNYWGPEKPLVALSPGDGYLLVAGGTRLLAFRPTHPAKQILSPLSQTAQTPSHRPRAKAAAAVSNAPARTPSIGPHGKITIPVGPRPDAVVLNARTHKVYVANYNVYGLGSTVTVIDEATDATSTATVGGNPRAIAVNPRTDKIYVADETSNTVTVIDGRTNAPTTVKVGIAPWVIAVNPATNKIYVANHGSNAVTVIDGRTNATTSVDVGGFSDLVAVNPVTDKIYVPLEGGSGRRGSVVVIDGATDATTTIPVGYSPIAIAVNPATDKIYVTGGGSGPGTTAVTVIDGTANTTRVIPLSGITAPDAIAVNPVTNRVYVDGYNSGRVTVIDGATNETVGVIPVGANPNALAVNPRTDQIFVTNPESNTLSVIDGATDAPRSVAVGQRPVALAVDRMTNRVYVANGNDDTVSIVKP